MRKLCRAVFSRYFISAITILAELVLLLFLVLYAYNYSLPIYLFMVLLNALAVISLINREANPEYKVSWLTVIILVPLFGMVLYLLFYSRHVSGKRAAFMNRIMRGFEECDGAPEWTAENFLSLKEGSDLAAGKARSILEDDRSALIYRETSAKYFHLGEEMFYELLKDLERAEKYIFLEYFIIEEGKMWSKILSVLRECVKRGVEVRVMYDDIGCMSKLPAHYDAKLRKEGIKCVRFSPVNPSISTAHNNRDHRKICIIDGEIAYTGGINIADEYINRNRRFGHWKDGGIRIEGLAVLGLLRLFISTWDFSTGKISDYKALRATVKPAKNSDGGYYIPFGCGPAPIYKRPVGKHVFLNIINQAGKYVYITTPYLIIDYDLTESLRNAAMRGVDVRIITPSVADKKMVKVMTKSSYSYLMEAGVKIYEYLPGFIHEKTVISDDTYAVIGTINFDYRILAQHYEDAVWIYGAEVVLSAKEEFLKTLSLSDEQSEREAKLTFREKIVKNGIRMFAPLL